MKQTVTILRALILLELLIALRTSTDSIASIGYFIVILALVPLAVGSNPELLSTIAPAMIWIASLIASLPQMERVFSRAGGQVDDLLLVPLTLPLVVLGKVAANWLITSLPLVVASPLIALLFGLPSGGMAPLALALGIGTAALHLLGAMAAALTMGARQTAVLIALLILPLAMPVLIFGITASVRGFAGASTDAPLALLTAVALIFAVFCPVATAFSLKSLDTA